MKFIELAPLYEPRQEIEEIEREIRGVLRDAVYLPLIRFIGRSSTTLKNAGDVEYTAIIAALNRGTITYNMGRFSGTFNAALSRELKAMGAKWDPTRANFRFPKGDLPTAVEQAIQVSTARFKEKLKVLDSTLQKVLPEDVAKSVNVADSLDKSMARVAKHFQDNVKRVGITPTLTPEMNRQITQEWEKDLRRYIKKFTAEEVTKLRGEIRQAVFAGDRYGSLVKGIQDSYKVSANKARFLARQEVKLLTTQYQEARYTEAGCEEYRWDCVKGTGAHPVRPDHKALDGTIQRWDSPPVTNKKTGARNHPGQDFGCRCKARPLVRVKAA